MPLTAVNGVNGASQFFAEDAFEDVTTRARLECSVHILVGVKGGNDDDFGFFTLEIVDLSKLDRTSTIPLLYVYTSKEVA